MFETFSVKSCYIAIDNVLSSYSYGKLNSIVVDIGYDTTHTVPIYELFFLFFL